MNTNDYIKYLTEQFVKIINHPKGKKGEEQQVDQVHSYSNHWFGLFPFTLKFLKRERPDL